MSLQRPLVLAGVLIALILGYVFRSHFSDPGIPFLQPIQPKLAPLPGKNSVGNPTEEITCDGIPLPCIRDPPKTPQPGAVWTPSDDGTSGVTRVTENASLLFSHKRFADLDALISRYSTLQYRFDDGRFKLSGVSVFFDQTFGTLANGESIQGLVGPWTAANPRSVGAANRHSSRLAQRCVARARQWICEYSLARGVAVVSRAPGTGTDGAERF
jgi:hypothetical protein